MTTRYGIKEKRWVTDEVYDVHVWNDTKLIAVVGFTSQQQNGGIFYQIPSKEIHLHNTELIKSLARREIEGLF